MIFCLYSLILLPREQESNDGEILLIQECIVAVYVGTKIAEFFGHLTFIKGDKIADIEEIPVSVEVANLGGDLHEEEELAVDTAVDLEDIVDTGNIGDDGNLVEVGELEEDVIVRSVFAHDLNKCRDFVDFFSIEGDDCLFLGIDFLSENQYLKDDQTEYKNEERGERYEDNGIHRRI